MLVFPVFAHEKRPSLDDRGSGQVIRPAHRGKGLGRASVLRAAIQIAADKGAYKLALSSNQRRLDAHRFYDGMGYPPASAFSIATGLRT